MNNGMSGERLSATVLLGGGSPRSFADPTRFLRQVLDVILRDEAVASVERALEPARFPGRSH